MATYSPPSSPPHVQGRPRAVTSMSHASTHSHKSSRLDEEKKLELVESKREQRMLEGKANPMKALQEAQPAAVALEDSTIQNVRNIQYRDRDGNVIDPDKSNPTRPRMERPLDTIRAFNAAAEGTTSRRSSYQRPASQFSSFDAPSRRSSYYGSPNTPYSHGSRAPPGRGPGGYYNNQQNNHGNHNIHNNYNNHNSHNGHNSHNNRNPFHGGYRPDQGDADYNQHQPQSRHQRFQSAPMSMETQMNQNQLHPQMSHVSQHGHQQSYETMNTAISASGSDEMSKSTNPSSQNSSYDQLHQIARKPEDIYNSHRQNGNMMRGQNPQHVMGNHDNYGQQQRQQQQLPPPPPPQHQWNGRRVDEYGMEISDNPAPLPKQNFMSGVREMAPGNGGKGDKRSSWLKRTFSKKA